MIRIEPDTLGPALFTSEQLLTAASVVAEFPGQHYDFTEERFKKDSITWSRLMLWRWPANRGDLPVRYWIDPDGTVAVIEDADWVTEEEYPAWVLADFEQEN